MAFAILIAILLLSFVQMAMQLFIFDKARTGITELEHIDTTNNQRMKEREAQVLSVLHNQDQIENAVNATLEKLLKMEAAGK